MYNNSNPVLDQVNMCIKQGDFICIKGPSGSGKSTLLNIIGLIDDVTSGEYYLNNQETSKLNKTELARLRNEVFGFVFQQYHLIPYLTVKDNIMMPFLFGKKSFAQFSENAILDFCEQFNILTILEKRADLLSGGEKQRVSLVRAVIKNAEIIIADEPTGNLDEGNSLSVIEYLHTLNNEGKTVIMVTHNTAIWESAPNRYNLEKGNLEKYV
ncbi:ABC transporter ATP-binding protein [Bacillus kwashiorkori]|uniref:ABC transporter ATP-binding protein n=1 Tax=Bacillus kwashiorkori TaxID=1522318 RepID=UPI00131A322F|nr:ABC transporter ATP-binding protein [Bacillus kwashiorkori]